MSSELAKVYAPPTPVEAPIPLTVVGRGRAGEVDDLTPLQHAWVEANGFDGASGASLALPGPDGRIARVLVGLGDDSSADPCGPAEWNLGRAAAALAKGSYRLTGNGGYDPTLLAIAWGLGAYRHRRFKSGGGERDGARLVMPEGADSGRVMATVAAIYHARDLINAPANALGPAELASAVEGVATRYGARLVVHRGEDPGFAEAFPLIEAVGRASTRRPRLVDLTWGAPSAPKITLVGKGICFDTGGLDIKPASGMLLMKKDMGGAATAIAVADMVMALDLPVRLRLLVSAAENSIAGDAFRPGDVIRARNGTTVEIGNTDAEGRLVLADALTLADEEAPDLMISFATLTGAARVALGPDLPAFFSTDDGFAERLARTGGRQADPVWRMPFWQGYERMLDGATGDISNVSDSPFAGAITAALFLKKFVRNAAAYAHLDLFGWRQGNRALGPKGGEAQTARAVVAAIEELAARG